VGIIGSSADKFTESGKKLALSVIDTILRDERMHSSFLEQPIILISGHSPMGGVDIWSEEVADKLKIRKNIQTPEINQWDSVNSDKYALDATGHNKCNKECKHQAYIGSHHLIGFKERNLNIAILSDELYIIVADKYPLDYKGKKFKECYHCAKVGRDSINHIKSGACYTANAFEDIHNTNVHYIIINNY
jgi:hypothetical protein